MCSFGVTNSDIDIHKSNIISKNRGPDETTSITYNKIQFLHNLLHLTGKKTTQPFIKNDIYMVFNGEIYNYTDFGNYSSDGEVLIDLYLQHGVEFTKLLDGEFALCLIDFSLNTIVISNDIFACKPLWYEFQDNKFYVGSYNTQLLLSGFNNGTKLKANTTKIFNLTTYELINEFSNHVFDIKQYKTSYDDWIISFKKSIQKRVNNTQYGIFLGLSSGFDSGAIACELLNQKKDFTTYTILGKENNDIINKRLQLISDSYSYNISSNEKEEIRQNLIDYCEDFEYFNKFKNKNYTIKTDKASIGLSYICRQAVNDNKRIYLSGQGADEIISDYGFNGTKFYGHSEFGGKFPEDLETIFPWYSFYEGTQLQYLNKEEYIAGHHGIEARYPFLDKELVQEFLWLSCKLKNSKYKSVINEYLTRNNFPFINEKIGFNI